MQEESLFFIYCYLPWPWAFKPVSLMYPQVLWETKATLSSVCSGCCWPPVSAPPLSASYLLTTSPADGQSCWPFCFVVHFWFQNLWFWRLRDWAASGLWMLSADWLTFNCRPFLRQHLWAQYSVSFTFSPKDPNLPLASKQSPLGSSLWGVRQLLSW